MEQTEEYCRTMALETALEWRLFKLVSIDKDPRGTLKDFGQHMTDRETMLKLTIHQLR